MSVQPWLRSRIGGPGIALRLDASGYSYRCLSDEVGLTCGLNAEWQPSWLSPGRFPCIPIPGFNSRRVSDDATTSIASN